MYHCGEVKAELKEAELKEEEVEDPGKNLLLKLGISCRVLPIKLSRMEQP